MKTMDFEKNHVYVDNADRACEWAGLKTGDTATEENQSKLIAQVREKIKNYLQLDNVSFLFGTGSSIHLGAAGIQNIPEQVEKDIDASGDAELKEDFKKYVTALQKPLLDSLNPEKDKVFKDEREWDLIYDGTYIRNYDGEEETEQDADMSKHYGEILLQFELLLNYLTAMLYQREAEKDEEESSRIKNLITALKKSLFGICDVHERSTGNRDMERIKEKGLEQEFKRNKYLFHEKFLKSLMQRPLNLQRANLGPR